MCAKMVALNWELEAHLGKVKTEADTMMWKLSNLRRECDEQRLINERETPMLREDPNKDSKTYFVYKKC